MNNSVQTPFYVNVSKPNKKRDSAYKRSYEVLDAPENAKEKIKELSEEELRENLLDLYCKFYDERLIRTKTVDTLDNILANYLGKDRDCSWPKNKEENLDEFITSIQFLNRMSKRAIEDNEIVLESLVRTKKGVSSDEREFIKDCLEYNDDLSVSAMARITGRSKSTVSKI